MWQITLLDASFRGVTFDVMDMTDDVSRDVQAHYYPYVDGADQEDLGRQARQFSMTAVFWGDFYEFKLNQLLEALNKKGAGELVHPIFGVFPQVQLLNYKINHSAENYDYCTVSLQFVEHQDSNPFFALGHALALEELGIHLTDFVSEVMDLVQKGMGYYQMMQGIVERVNGVRQLFSRYALKVSRFFALFKSSGRVSSGRYGANQSSSAPPLSNTATSHMDIVSQPMAFVSDLMSVVSEELVQVAHDTTSAANQPEWGAVMTTINALEQLSEEDEGIKGIAQEDKQLLQITALLVLTKALLDVAMQILEAAQRQEKRLSPHEVETMVNDVRLFIQRLIDKLRHTFANEDVYAAIERLKTIAYRIQTIGLQVLALRPPLIKYTVKSSSNLHLLCHQLYQDYQRADEVLHLNPHIRNPNFIKAGEVLHVYST